jgi:hypothetical protein
VNLTVAPTMVGGVSKRIIEGVPVDSPLDLDLDRIVGGDRSLFFRYLSRNGRS